MKKLIPILLFIFFFSLFSQLAFCEDAKLPDLIPYRKGNKWGFCDKNKKIVIPCKYAYVFPFKEGLARVNLGGKATKPIGDSMLEVLDGKCGFINKTGKEIVPVKYDYAEDFCEGLALVLIYGKYGFIDKTGAVVIPLKYDLAKSFCESAAIVAIKKHSGTFGLLYGLINKKGEKLTSLKYYSFGYDLGFDTDFNQNIARYSDTKPPSKNDKTFYIDRKTGKETDVTKYGAIGKFYNGLARIEYKGLWGFVDKNFNTVIPFKYDDADDFREGLAAVNIDGKWGYIDKHNNIIIPFRYDDASDFKEGLASVLLNGKVGFINKKGAVIIPCKYYCYQIGAEAYASVHPYYFKNGLGAVGLNKKYGCINKNDKIIVPIKYDDVRFDNDYSIRYDDVKSNNDNLIWTIIKDKAGYIDKNGTEYWED